MNQSTSHYRVRLTQARGNSSIYTMVVNSDGNVFDKIHAAYKYAVTPETKIEYKLLGHGEPPFRVRYRSFHTIDQAATYIRGYSGHCSTYRPALDDFTDMGMLDSDADIEARETYHEERAESRNAE